MQIAPALFFEVPIASLVGSGLLKIDPVVEPSLDLTKPLPAKSVEVLSFADLKNLYAKSEVPSHRYGFLEATKIASASLEKSVSAADSVKGLSLSQTNLSIGAELEAILGELEEIEGDTTYEQLTCAGYNPRYPCSSCLDRTECRLLRRSVLCRQPGVCELLRLLWWSVERSWYCPGNRTI